MILNPIFAKWYFIVDLLMQHKFFLCKSYWSKLENMRNEPNNTHVHWTFLHANSTFFHVLLKTLSHMHDKGGETLTKGASGGKSIVLSYLKLVSLLPKCRFCFVP